MKKFIIVLLMLSSCASIQGRLNDPYYDFREKINESYDKGIVCIGMKYWQVVDLWGKPLYCSERLDRYDRVIRRCMFEFRNSEKTVEYILYFVDENLENIKTYTYYR